MMEGQCCDRGNFSTTRASDTREGQVRVGADVPSARGETGYFVWVVKQSKFVGCCPGVRALTVRGCFAVAPVDMLAVEVPKIQTGVWERRDARRCEQARNQGGAGGAKSHRKFLAPLGKMCWI